MTFETHFADCHAITLAWGSCGMPACSVTCNNSHSLSLQLPAVRWGDQVLVRACFFEEQHRGFAQDIIWENLKIIFFSFSPAPNHQASQPHCLLSAALSRLTLRPISESHAPSRCPCLLHLPPGRCGPSSAVMLLSRRPVPRISLCLSSGTQSWARQYSGS